MMAGEDLEGLTVAQLRDRLVALGETPASKLRKADLIDMVEQSESALSEDEEQERDWESEEDLPAPGETAQLTKKLDALDGGEEGLMEETWSELDDSSDIPLGMFEPELQAGSKSPVDSEAEAKQFFEKEDEQAAAAAATKFFAEEEEKPQQKQSAPEGFFEDEARDVNTITRDVHTMTVPQLKDELRSHGLKVGGVKAELQERLLDFLANGPSAEAVSPVAKKSAAPSIMGARPSAFASPANAQRKVTPERDWGDNRRVFVWGLPFRARPQELVRLVEERFGRVERVEGMFVFGRASGRAWVTFETQDSAKMAANTRDEISLGERTIKFAPPWSRPSRQALRDITAQIPARDPPPASFAPQQSPPRGRMYEDMGERVPYRDGPGSATQYRSASGTGTQYRSPPGSETLDRRSLSPARATKFEERRTVFVGRLPDETTKEDLRAVFESMGRVKGIRMGISDGEFQGFAHVEFVDADAAALAASSQVEVLGASVKMNIAADGKRDDREEAFPLPEHLHGVLIGVRGRRVRELEELSGARIGFTLTPEPSMVVRGFPAQRRQAWQAAQRHLANAGTDTFPIAKEKWSVVIGARGARIRGLEEQSGAKLQLVEDPAPSLRVFGLPSERREALALVREILDAETEELFPVPAKYHGLLVGKRGMTVKELQRESGAFISLVKLPEPAMLVKGTDQQRDKAWGITQKLLDELPGVLAEIRGMEGVGSEDLLEMGDEDIYGNDTDGLPVDGTEVVWEEAVARAVEKAKNAYKEERLEMIRSERGV